ncbi:CIC11C00000001573 [Sungouiella intermedia]|uniref:CIC11C00000001573 n=1 Tax=Sungouiella intermedia TaxID=45354 RepID=A0A1L0D771_9ASCO|nr:CIC11C00000001573 [[Candida] intermedia]
MKVSILLSLALAVNARLTAKDNLVFNTADNEASLDEMWGEMWPFQGINTFAHLPLQNCLTDRNLQYDIAVIGVPFDTATSYRSGARFGPRAIRAASQRQTSLRGYNPRASFNPYLSWANIMDCGDIPVTPMDNTLAFKQMTLGFEELLLEHTSSNSTEQPPRYVALGGDHSVLLPHIRALHKLYGPLNIIHFDAHLDTWKPDKYPSFWHTHQSELNHGLMLWKAYEEGLTTKHNVHAGIRTKLSSEEDLADDDEQNFVRINADDIWIDGVNSVVDKILATVPADTPTYISVDIDVLDPGFGSGTGTQEPGGWLPRELIYVLRRLEGLTVVGADVVEVNPDFDHAEITSTNGAQVVYELVTSMVKKGPVTLPVNKSPKKTKILSANEFVEGKETRLDQMDAKVQMLNEKAAELRKQLREVEDLKVQLANEIEQVKTLLMLSQ